MYFAIGSAVCLLATTAVAHSAVQLHLRNELDDYLAIHYVNSRTGETKVIEENVKPRSTFTIQSYISHRFQVLQKPNPETGQCGTDEKKVCKIGYFQVTEPNEQEFRIKEGFEIEAVKESQSVSRDLLSLVNFNVVENPSDILATCKEKATRRVNELDGIDHGESLIKKIQAELHDCMTVGLTPQIKASTDQVEFEQSLRRQASNIAENFTCVNTDLESSPDVATEEWFSPTDLVTRTVHKKLDRPASRIHVVKNFASPEECHAMEEEAKGNLGVATTADGKGGKAIFVGRKAMQASIRPKFHDDGSSIEGDHISLLSGRVYEYTNYVLDTNITHFGQEPLMSIQYFGRGRHDISPDRYTPHCDGKCNGEDFVSGNRMATIVIYCTIPEQGGFTNFQNANVHVRPDVGSAVFFSYIDPSTNATDNGLTRHSGCPVYEGEKKIITQWVRIGVSSETPHTAFNSLKVLKSEHND